MRVTLILVGSLAAIASAAPKASLSTVSLYSTASVSGRPMAVTQGFDHYSEVIPTGTTTSDISTATGYPTDLIVSLLSSLKQDNGPGFAHIADDGVLRDDALNGSIVAAQPLTKDEILALLSTRPPAWEPYMSHLTDLFSNVSGHDISNTTTYTSPPAHFKAVEFDGPAKDSTSAELDAQFDQLVSQKKIDTTSVEEKYAALMAEKKDELDAVEYETSQNPAWLAQPGASAKPLWCLGALCVSHDACRFMGCRACVYVDLFTVGKRVCVGELGSL